MNSRAREKERERERDRQTDRQTDRQAELLDLSLDQDSKETNVYSDLPSHCTDGQQ